MTVNAKLDHYQKGRSESRAPIYFFVFRPSTNDSNEAVSAATLARGSDVRLRGALALTPLACELYSTKKLA